MSTAAGLPIPYALPDLSHRATQVVGNVQGALVTSDDSIDAIRNGIADLIAFGVRPE